MSAHPTQSDQNVSLVLYLPSVEVSACDNDKYQPPRCFDVMIQLLYIQMLIQQPYSYTLLLVHLQSINQLFSTYLSLLHMLHARQNPLKALSKLVDRRSVHLDLPLRQQPPRHLPEHLAKLKVLWLSLHLVRTEREELADDRVAQRRLHLHLVVDALDLVFWDGEKCAVDTAGRGHGGDGDLRRVAFGDAVEDVGDGVGGPFFDILRAGRGVVVECCVGAEALDVFEVAG